MTNIHGHEHWPSTEHVLTQAERQERSRRTLWPATRPHKPPAPVEYLHTPTAPELVTRGLPPADDDAGETWTPQRLPDVREGLLRRLGLVTDAEPDTTDHDSTEE